MGLRDGHEPSGASTTPGRRKDAKPQTLYFHAGGRLAATAAGRRAAEDGFDEYVSDPAKPVPYIDKIGIGMVREYMTADQRFAAPPARRARLSRPTSLDEDVTVAGPIEAELHVSTTGTDSDWVVKLIDVYPDDYPDPDPNPTGVQMGGYQQLVRGDVDARQVPQQLREAGAVRAGQADAGRSSRCPTSATRSAPGHRIMVQVQSTLVPARRPQSADVLRHLHGKEADFQKATQRVYRSPEMASGVTVRVVK